MADRQTTALDQDRSGRAGMGLFLALGLVVSAVVLAFAAKDVVPTRNKIQVKGYSEMPVTSDMGTWSGQFSGRADTLAKAYAEVEAARKKVLAFLQTQGFATQAVEFSPVQTMVQFKTLPSGAMSSEVQGYELSQTVSLTSTDVQRLDKLSREVTELIRDGVAFMSFSPQYYFTGLEASKLQLLAEATANAKERAAALATASGAKVGTLQSARQGVFQVTSRVSTDVTDYGMYDTSSIDKTIKAVVTAEFGIR